MILPKKYNAPYKVPSMMDAIPLEDTSSSIGMEGMMKSKLALASEFNNPTARRITYRDPRNYMFFGDEGTGNKLGDLGNVMVSSYDNYITPSIQDVNGKLQFIQQPWSNQNWQRSEEQSLRFNTPEEAQYFGENYKRVAPMMKYNFNAVNVLPEVTITANKPYIYNYNKL